MNTVGLPATAEELRRFLAGHMGGREADYVVSPVLGGLTNRNWRVDLKDGLESYFVKVPGPGTDEFIDRATVHAAAQQASDLGIGPAVLFYDPETGIEVDELLDEYQPCNALDVTRAEVGAEVMGLYRAMNSSPSLPQTKTVFDMVDEHLTQVRRDGTALPRWVEDVLVSCEQASACFQASGLDIVPCHNDPGAGNFMRPKSSGAKPMKLIDFDYASNNERAYEIGVFVGFNFYDDEQTRLAIEAYFGRCDSTMWARVQVCRAIADVKWGLWGLVNARAQASDFDYFKYGMWDLRRAEYEINRPDWRDMLGRL